MRNFLVLILFCSFALKGFAQSPAEAPLPPRLQGLPAEIEMIHFPNPVFATLVETKDTMYAWKHNTSAMAKEAIQVEEVGAFLYKKGSWTLRVAMDTKDFARLYKCPKGKMQQGQPYTFEKNWRQGSQLYGGPAMWYVIGTKGSGEKICGYSIIYTEGSTIDKH